ncbi:hypothetical protein B0T17DRAFT_597228 [Bombardia bombarda]|uniref:Uncharacterized protein n=1 Tax=Bombardia bombarda TaxID=252184 RepID=A0AA39X7E7_9PEZI|nr:hypothetical protein B0T17DRAFT_597228 [Bombardia bombarda]
MACAYANTSASASANANPQSSLPSPLSSLPSPLAFELRNPLSATPRCAAVGHHRPAPRQQQQQQQMSMTDCQSMSCLASGPALLARLPRSSYLTHSIPSRTFATPSAEEKEKSGPSDWTAYCTARVTHTYVGRKILYVDRPRGREACPGRSLNCRTKDGAEPLKMQRFTLFTSDEAVRRGICLGLKVWGRSFGLGMKVVLGCLSRHHRLLKNGIYCRPSCERGGLEGWYKRQY